MTEVPREIGRLRALRLLDLSWNDFLSLPSEIGDLPFLEELNVRRPPRALRRLTRWQLTRCDELTWLPLSLDRLPATTKIYVSCGARFLFVADGVCA